MPHVVLDQPDIVDTFVDYYAPNADGSPPGFNDIEIEWRDKNLDRHPVKIRTLRGGNFTLEKNGFELVTHYSNVTDLSTKEALKNEYYPEVAETIRKATGASSVKILNSSVRTQSEFDVDMKTGKVLVSGVVRRVHVDFSPDGIYEDVAERVGEEYVESIKGRWKLVNAWRPIKTIERDPLCVADATSVPEEDLVMFHKLKPENPGVVAKRYFVKAGEKEHAWYYAPQQRPDELLMFTQYSDLPSRSLADRVAHASFVLPGTEDKPTRESVEVRALVVF